MGKNRMNICGHWECQSKRESWLNHSIGLDSDSEFIVKWINEGQPINWSAHVDMREGQRRIPAFHSKDALENGYCINRVKYTDARFGKVTKLTWLGYVKVDKGQYRPLHLIIKISRKDGMTPVTIATVYDPSTKPWMWNQDFTLKVCFEEQP